MQKKCSFIFMLKASSKKIEKERKVKKLEWGWEREGNKGEKQGGKWMNDKGFALKIEFQISKKN